MRSRDIRIRRKPLIQPRNDLLRAGRSAPIAHQITHDRKQRDELHARIPHPIIRHIPNEGGRGAASLDVGPDGVALCAEGEGEEGGADVGGDASDDDLAPPRRADLLPKLGVVPGVDLALALDEGGVWVHVQDLLGQGAVGARLGGGGEDDWEVEELAEGGVGEEVVAVEGGVPVAGDVVEADLEVEDEEDLCGGRG